MTRNQLQLLFGQHRAIAELFAAGKIIQVRTTNGDWLEISNPHFDRGSEYRVKPEPTKPRSFWRFEYRDHRGVFRLAEDIYCSADLAASDGMRRCCFDYVRAVEFREVVD